MNGTEGGIEGARKGWKNRLLGPVLIIIIIALAGMKHNYCGQKTQYPDNNCLS